MLTGYRTPPFVFFLMDLIVLQNKITNNCMLCRGGSGEQTEIIESTVYHAAWFRPAPSPRCAPPRLDSRVICASFRLGRLKIAAHDRLTAALLENRRML